MMASPSGDNKRAGEKDSSSSKRPRQQLIGTHDGTFHCDEVLAISLLSCLPEYDEPTIKRTRDEELLSQCDVVVDVGAVYDPTRHRYDHHQKSFNDTMNSLNSDYPWEIKLSSAGLVYFHFGHKVIGKIIDKEDDSDVVIALYGKIYENFVQEVDANDNGISTHDGQPRYNISTDLCHRVKDMNPHWNSDSKDDDCFHDAVEMVKKEFIAKVRHFYDVWWPAKEIVLAGINDRHKVHESGEIIELECYVPWKEHLADLEQQLKLHDKIKFVVYSDVQKHWRVQSVPTHPSSFDTRIPLKTEWWGLRDQKLSILSGIPSCVFVHANGFIGGNTSKAGAIKMAEHSMESYQKKPPSEPM